MAKVTKSQVRAATAILRHDIKAGYFVSGAEAAEEVVAQKYRGSNSAARTLALFIQQQQFDLRLNADGSPMNDKDEYELRLAALDETKRSPKNKRFAALKAKLEGVSTAPTMSEADLLAALDALDNESEADEAAA